MMMWMSYFRIILLLLSNVTICLCNVDIFVSVAEMMKLHNSNRKVDIVQNGDLRRDAINFQMVVLSHINQLNFMWRSTSRVPIFYVLNVTFPDGSLLLDKPRFTVPVEGTIPSNFSDVGFILSCLPGIEGAVQVYLWFTYTYPSVAEPTRFKLKRRKFCSNSAGPGVVPFKPSDVSDDVTDDPYVVRQPTLRDHDSGLKLDKKDNRYQKEINPANPKGSSEVSTSHLSFYILGAVVVLAIVVAALSVAFLIRRRGATPSPSMEHHNNSVIGSNNRLTISTRLPPGSSTEAETLLFPVSLQSPQYVAYSTGPSNLRVPANSSVNISSPYYPQHCSQAIPMKANMTTQDSPSEFSKLSSSRHYSPIASVFLAESRNIDVSHWFEQLYVDPFKIERLADHQSPVLEGAFGIIEFAVIKSDSSESPNYDIMLKALKQNSSEAQRSIFLEEGLLFAGLPHHDNVLQVLAASSSSDLNENCRISPLMLCYPRTTHGNLKLFLKNIEQGSEKNLLTQDIVGMSLQALDGIMHLHSYRVIHKDIASRNFVLDSVNCHLLVQICDPALTRDMFSNDYNCLGDNENRPVKWLAPESLIDQQYSTASDVWSFGVFVWELLTLAQNPYLEIDSSDMAEFLMTGERLRQPLNCPDELFGIIYCCWAPSLHARPTMGRLHCALRDFYATIIDYI